MRLDQSSLFRPNNLALRFTDPPASAAKCRHQMSAHRPAWLLVCDLSGLLAPLQFKMLTMCVHDGDQRSALDVIPQELCIWPFETGPVTCLSECLHMCVPATVSQRATLDGRPSLLACSSKWDGLVATESQETSLLCFAF